MRTTMLFIEFLMGGILVLVALIFLVSVSPSKEQAIIDLFDENGCLSGGVLLSTIFVAAAYTIGIVSEYITRGLFEGKLDEIKINRMRIYLKENYENLRKSPILKKYLKIPLNKIDAEIGKKEALECIGPMRYHVMMENSELYQEIESHLHKLRLTRILFLVVGLFFIGTVCRLFVTRYLYQDFSLFLLAVLVLLAPTAYINFRAIKDRSDRYCRAVERSYRVLVLDP